MRLTGGLWLWPWLWPLCVCLCQCCLNHHPVIFFYCIRQVLSQQQVSCNQRTPKSRLQVCWFPLDVFFIISSNLTPVNRSFINEKQKGQLSHIIFVGQSKKRRKITQACKMWRKHFTLIYRSGTVNSKSFVGKVLLRIKRKFELTYPL